MTYDAPEREVSLLEIAIEGGEGFGLAGMDGSGNDWEFPQQRGSVEAQINETTMTEEIV